MKRAEPSAEACPPALPRSSGVKAVAAAAGVSLGTVSNVLNRPDRVSEPTRAKVEKAMAELGFVRNESARQLRAGRSHTLAYVMLDATNPFFTDVAQGIEDAAEASGLSLFTCNSDNRSDKEGAYLDRLEQQRVQGILITPVDAEAPALDELPRRGTPIVIVDRTRSANTHCSVAVDDVHGGSLAVNHLLEMGHRRIAFVGGPNTLGQVRDRRLGARQALDARLSTGANQALRAANRPLGASQALDAANRPQGASQALDAASRAPARADSSDAHLTDVLTSALTVAEGRNAGERLAGLPAAARPTAALCANDLLALGLLQQCVSLGLRVPEDLAIVGYDDIEFAAAAAVPLTSVRQPRRQLGKRAAELLLDEAGNPDHRHQQVLFTPELVVRASTRRVTS